jgi:hypothetical protein
MLSLVVIHVPGKGIVNSNIGKLMYLGELVNKSQRSSVFSMRFGAILETIDENIG